MRLSVIAVTLLSWGCNAGPSQEQKGVESRLRDRGAVVVTQSGDLGMPLEPLAPAIRESLREIEVVRIGDGSIDAVWDLEASSPQGVLLLECSPEALSTSRMEQIAAWAKGGRGIIIQSPQLQLSSYLLPPPHYLEVDFSEGGWELDQNSKLLLGVRSLSNPLWCADLSSDVLSGSASLRFRRMRRGPGITYSAPYEIVKDIDSIFSANNEEIIPIIWGPYDSGEETFVLFASTFQGSRVLWFAGRIDVENKGCQPKFDDAMLWANLMHWLAGKPLAEVGKT